MKLFGTAILAFAVGAFVGMAFGGYVLVGWMHRDAAAFNSQERLRASVSLRALDDLQAGHVDQAKSFLAQQIAIYYRSMQQRQSLRLKRRSCCSTSKPAVRLRRS